MPAWLFIWIARWASGERFRKATPAERRWYSAFFLFMPIYMFFFVRLGHSFLDRAGAVSIWFYMMGCLAVLGLCTFLWARFVPALVSVIVAVAVWGVMFWMSFTGRFFS
jgi:hypothetical protein